MTVEIAGSDVRDRLAGESIGDSEASKQVTSNLDAYRGGVLHLVVHLSGGSVWESSEKLTAFINRTAMPMREPIDLTWLGVTGLITDGVLHEDENKLREYNARQVLVSLTERVNGGLLDMKTNDQDQPVVADDVPVQTS